MFKIDPNLYVLLAVLLLTLPMSWIIAVICAVCIHEICHMVAIKLLGGKILSITLTSSGAAIEMRIGSYWRECVCTLAGPAGSLMLLCLSSVSPKLSVCGFIHGMYNLLPIYPMDGGRALYCILAMIFPKNGCTVGKIVENIACILLGTLAVWGYFVWQQKVQWLAVFLFLLIRGIIRKRPCKQRKIRVQ